jgi:hypothetical protein
LVYGEDITQELDLIHIQRTQEDIEALAEIDKLGVMPSKLEDFDFDRTAVVKPWGFEYMVHESPNKSICAWVLHFNNNGSGTSLHCHRAKKTRIAVLAGEILLRSIHEEFKISQETQVIIDSGTFHSLSALSSVTIVSEIETPSNNTYAVRWKDQWSRDRQDYESLCSLVKSSSIDCPYKTDHNLKGQIDRLILESNDLFMTYR